MNTPFEPAGADAPQIVYVRPVNEAELTDDIRQQAGDTAELFSVHTADGERLALVSGRKLAFRLAREHDFTPVDVH